MDYGNGMSPADFSALVGNNRGYGENMMGMWWMMIMFLYFMNNGWGNGFGGFGRNGGGMVPFAMQQETQAEVQRGFDQQALMAGIGNLNNTVSNGFANAEVARCNAQMNLMQTLNNNQMNLQQTLNGNQLGLYQGLNQLVLGQQTANSANQAGIADLKYTVATENCADRQAISDGLRDVIANNTANTNALAQTINGGIQSIKDDLCADRIAAKDAQIQALQNQLNMANLAASQSEQTARLIQDNNAQTAALIQRISPAPVPSYQVPNPATGCCGQYYGCGCAG